MVQNMESCDKLKDGSLQSVAYASWIDCSNPNICRMTFFEDPFQESCFYEMSGQQG